MSYPAFRPSIDELNYFVVSLLVLTAAFTAFSGNLNINTTLLYLGASLACLFFREMGQRTVAQWMDGKVTFNLSMEGSTVTIIGAIMAVITGWPILLLFPIYNTFDIENYEQWGKSIGSMWAKRQYWIASSGILGLFIGWAIMASLGFPVVAKVISLFTIFQLLPFDYSGIPTGPLDGSYIMKWSGLVWLIYFGSAFITLAVV